MTYETVFSLINLSVLPAWFLLIFLPRFSVTRALVHSAVYPVALGVFYVSAMIWGIASGVVGSGEGNFTSVSGISAIFQSPMGVLIGWAHYLVFDLFVGAWIARDSQRRGLAHLATAPCLFLTFLLGPTGLLLYLLLRFAFRKGGSSLEEAATPA